MKLIRKDDPMGYYDCTPLPPLMPEDEENPKDDVMETHLDISVEEVRQLLADEMANMQVAMVNMQMETQKEMAAIHAQLSAVPTILWSSVGLGTYAITSSCDEYVPYTEIVSKPLL